MAGIFFKADVARPWQGESIKEDFEKADVVAGRVMVEEGDGALCFFDSGAVCIYETLRWVLPPISRPSVCLECGALS